MEGNSQWTHSCVRWWTFGLSMNKSVPFESARSWLGQLRVLVGLILALFRGVRTEGRVPHHL